MSHHTYRCVRNEGRLWNQVSVPWHRRFQVSNKPSLCLAMVPVAPCCPWSPSPRRICCSLNIKSGQVNFKLNLYFSSVKDYGYKSVTKEDTNRTILKSFWQKNHTKLEHIDYKDVYVHYETELTFSLRARRAKWLVFFNLFVHGCGRRQDQRIVRLRVKRK